MTLPQRAYSSRKYCVNCSGVFVSGSTPCCAIRSRMSNSATAFDVAWLSLARMSFGVAAGATNPYHTTISASGSPASATVGTLGRLATRRGPELMAYYEDILTVIKHPVIPTVNPIVGYNPSSALIAKVCNRFRQVISVNVKACHAYLLNLMAAVDHEISYAGDDLPPSLNAFGFGVTGITGRETNIVPKTHRRYLDLYEAGNLSELAAVYTGLTRFGQYLSKWQPAQARPVKMAMHVLKLPGGKGGLRTPYLMPGREELETFKDGLLRLGLPEIEELARAAGLRS